MENLLDTIAVATYTSLVLFFIVAVATYRVKWMFSSHKYYSIVLAPKGGIVVSRAEAREVWFVDSSHDAELNYPDWVSFLFDMGVFVFDPSYGKDSGRSPLLVRNGKEQFIVDPTTRLTIMSDGGLYWFEDEESLFENLGVCIMTPADLVKYIKVA